MLVGTLSAPCHPPVPWAGGWWQPLLAALSRLLLQAEFLVCRAMPVLPGGLALGCGAVLLLLLCQKELGAEQRGLLLQRGTAGHHPSQHHPGECTQTGPSNSPWASGCVGDHLKVPQQSPSHLQHRLRSLALVPMPKA